MKIDILTLFPDMFEGFLNESIIKRAIQNKKVKIKTHNIRDYTEDKHGKVDDTPYGGGNGMVLMCQPVYDAVADLKTKKSKVVMLTPQGLPFNQKLAYKLAEEDHLIFICGHYEGFDERISDIVDMEISIGDYVLTGGELPCMVVTDAVVRLTPGVINENSHQEESFNNDLLDFPTYTKPREFKGKKVPEVLLSGNHEAIRKWREAARVHKTKLKRPDLLEKEVKVEEPKKNHNKSNKVTYVVNKNNRLKEIVSLDIEELEGYKISPKGQKETALKVNKIVIIKPSFIEKIIRANIKRKLNAILQKMALMLAGGDDSESPLVLGEAEHLKAIILNNYWHYLNPNYQELTIRKLNIIIKQLQIRKKMGFEVPEIAKEGKRR